MSASSFATVSAETRPPIRKITPAFSERDVHFENHSHSQPKRYYYGGYWASLRPKFAPLLRNLVSLDSMSGMGFGIFLAAAELPSSLLKDVTSRKAGASALLPEPNPTNGTHARTRRPESVASRDHGAVKKIARTETADGTSKGGAR